MQHERRRHSRSKADPGTVCTCTSADLSGRGDHYNLALRILDVAPDGACIVTTGRLRELSQVILDVTIPRLLGRIRARAHVRWSMTVEKAGRTAHVAGLRFDRVLDSTGDRREILSGGREKERNASKEPQRRWRRFKPVVHKLLCDPYDLKRMLGFKSNPAISLKDLSCGGAQVVCTKKLDKGSRADLQFELPAVRGPVSIETQVRWCRRDTLSLEPRWNTGLVFIRMSREDETKLKDAEQFHLG